jgi:hypothetical protein
MDGCACQLLKTSLHGPVMLSLLSFWSENGISSWDKGSLNSDFPGARTKLRRADPIQTQINAASEVTGGVSRQGHAEEGDGTDGKPAMAPWTSSPTPVLSSSGVEDGARLPHGSGCLQPPGVDVTGRGFAVAGASVTVLIHP